MQYYSVVIHHTFDHQPTHLVGQQAYLLHQAHLMITKATPKTLEGIAVVVDASNFNSFDEVHLKIVEMTFMPTLDVKASIYTDPPAKIVGSLVNIIVENQPVWIKLTINPLKMEDFMRTLLDVGRLLPEVDQQQVECRHHLQSLFKNKRIIRLDMQNDATSQAQAFQNARFPYEVTLGRIYVIATPFPTVSNVIAQEILRRYNQSTRMKLTDLYTEVISDRKPLWELKRFFDKTDHPEEQGQGWLIDLDIKADDPFSLTVFNEFLLPKLVKMAQTTLILITTDSRQVGDSIKHPTPILVKLIQ
jgi:hypothetical protein